MFDQQQRFLVAAPVLVFAENGHEGLRKRAFGEHTAQQVGQLEGDEEGIRRQPGAEGAGDDEVANETENSREQRHAADRRQGAEKIHGMPALPDSACERYNCTLCRCSSSVGRATDS